MKKLVIVYGLFSLIFLFGLGVTIIQGLTGTFFFPFGSFNEPDFGSIFELPDFRSEEEIERERMATLDSIADADSVAAAAAEAEARGRYYEDESNAQSRKGSWTCGDGTTIDGSWTNDGECDCSDCSDESVFTCSDGKNIPNSYLNDGECDCASSCEDESSQSFTVKSARAYFHNEPDPSTRRNAYLVQGEVGTYTAMSGGYVFIRFTNSRGAVSEGWVLLSDLQIN